MISRPQPPISRRRGVTCRRPGVVEQSRPRVPSKTYRFLLRMPEELRIRLSEAARRSERSLNAEIVHRLEESLEEKRRWRRVGRQAGVRSTKGRDMHRRRMQRRLLVAGVLAVLAASVVAGGLLSGGGVQTARPALETDEVPALLAKKLAAQATFAPASSHSYQEGERGASDDDWIQHATPGTDRIPSAAITEARNDWKKVKGRAPRRSSDWKPLGPTLAAGLPNRYRDRSVYNAGTPDFSGRIAHVAIDPRCGRRGSEEGRCRLWIANANGGVWRTNDALSDEPKWTYVSFGFEHNNTASIELDPNDRRARTLWVGTGEPNACGSGCEAGVGLYKSTNGGNSWTGPHGRLSFYNRAVGSIAVKPGDSDTIFAASGRAVRGVSNVCCGGADALIPGAPHFGLYRSQDGGDSWQLVHQGAPELCTGLHPDTVSLGGTPCSPRGARRVMIDPVDPNTVYVSYFARGIWRSKSNGDPGTWERIMAPIGDTFPVVIGNNERAEFDVVELPNGRTRMYVGVGGGVFVNPGGTPPTVPAYARFRRNDDVRTAAAATVAGAWIDLTDPVPDTPGYSSFGYCDPQCSYDNYVYVPPGADADTVYLLGDNEYNENNFGPGPPGRSNGRGVVLSTDAGETFTDMTDDTSDQLYPVELHPDHHALVTNPQNWRQFFDVGDGGIVRSNGTFVDDSGDCVDPKGYVGAQLTFCRMVLSRIPEKLTTLNDGLRTLHFYEINYNPNNPDQIVGGTQDNGSWENTSGGTWVNTNIADGGHNNFDIEDENFRQSGFQLGQLMVAYEPRNQEDQNWIADTLFVFYGSEGVPFIGPATNDPVHAGWLWTGREHVFRSTNYGRNQAMNVAQHREHCNIWYGDGDVDENGVFEPLLDICDDWKPLGDPGPNGRLTSDAFGGTDRAGGTVAAVERTRGDESTLWAATSTGRIFVSKNADADDASTVVFDRIDDDPTAAVDPPRYPTAIYVDPKDPNHAWIAYSGFNLKTPTTPGHVFEVRYVPGASTFELLEAGGPNEFGDIPATSLTVSGNGTIYVGTDFGVVASSGDGQWRQAGRGLPNVVAADLVLVPERGLLYAGTHGQGVWALEVDDS
jgi:Arc-like DNA binding domain